MPSLFFLGIHIRVIKNGYDLVDNYHICMKVAYFTFYLYTAIDKFNINTLCICLIFVYLNYTNLKRFIIAGMSWALLHQNYLKDNF